MPSLLLGPIHRHADASQVSVWLETDTPCEVEIRTVPAEPAHARRGAARTFTVAGHHYAIVVVDGLDPALTHPYEVWLTPGGPDSAVRVWPEPGMRPSLLRPVGGDGTVRLAFGSCRVTAPQEKPYTLSPEEDPRGLGTDALHALAVQMAGADPSTWPDALLLLGDQVYADHVSPRTARRIAERRDVTVPPGEEIADFEEYTWLYQEAWSQPEIRWLLSTTPTAMIADDHDVRDDWNISAAWRARIRSMPWWDRRITGGIMAYWLYQHLGNLSPQERAADPIHRAVTALGSRGEDAENLLRAFARRADAAADLAALAAGVTGAADPAEPDEPGESGGTGAAGRAGGAAGAVAGEQPPEPPRWSFRWDLGRTRLIGIDSRLGRLVAPAGTRAMVNDAQWEWVREQTRHSGEVDHLLLATSVPFLLTPSIHHVEATSERLASGRFGRLVARAAERLRQTLDLEHWPAFGASFRAMCELLRAVATGEHGPAPASVVILSGDVHHAYLTRVRLTPSYLARARRAPAGREGTSPIWQAVCSPLRNPLGPNFRRIDAASRLRPAGAVARGGARLFGTAGDELTWTVTDGPWFDSQLATLELTGRTATLILAKTEPDGEPDGFEEVLRAPLTGR